MAVLQDLQIGDRYRFLDITNCEVAHSRGIGALGIRRPQEAITNEQSAPTPGPPLGRGHSLDLAIPVGARGCHRARITAHLAHDVSDYSLDDIGNARAAQCNETANRQEDRRPLRRRLV